MVTVEVTVEVTWVEDSEEDMEAIYQEVLGKDLLETIELNTMCYTLNYKTNIIIGNKLKYNFTPVLSSLTTTDIFNQWKLSMCTYLEDLGKTPLDMLGWKEDISLLN